MVGRSRVGAALLALCVGVAAPSLLRSAYAQQAAWSLAWEAPADCPSEANVRDAVAQLLGTSAPPPASVSARAVVQRTSSDHWIVQLTTVREGARGERVVEATSCPSLANATALIVALTIDPERVAAHTAAPAPSASTSATASIASTAAAAPSVAAVAPVPSASASGSPPPPTPSSRPAPTPAPAPSVAVLAPPRDRPSATPADEGPVVPRRFALLLEGVGDLGSLPRLSDGLAGGLAVTFDALRLEAFGAYLFPQSSHPASVPSIGSNIDLVVGGLRGCFLPPRRVLELGVCGGLEIGQLQGSGFGSLRSPYQTFTPSSQGGLWVAPVVGGRLAWRIAPYFSLVIDLGVAIPLERDVFSISGVPGTLHQASPVVARGAAGPELRF
jgi:hypothetical protein